MQIKNTEGEREYLKYWFIKGMTNLNVKQQGTVR